MFKIRHGKKKAGHDNTTTNQPEGLRKLYCAKCHGQVVHRKVPGGGWKCLICGETH